jgi:hypothetical protein
MKVMIGPQLELISFLRRNANIINVNDEEWFYVPFWFKDNGDTLEMVGFEQLPTYLKDAIKSFRDGA